VTEVEGRLVVMCSEVSNFLIFGRGRDFRRCSFIVGNEGGGGGQIEAGNWDKDFSHFSGAGSITVIKV